MLSRNFRLQRVGDISWLFDNYEFATVSRGLDELMVIDVSRSNRDLPRFCRTVQSIAEQCFIPLTVGGGLTSLQVAHEYMRSGADKLLINTALSTEEQLCHRLADLYGRQCIMAGVDYKLDANGRTRVFYNNGSYRKEETVSDWLQQLYGKAVGEVLLQSIDSDGTGQGLNLPILDEISPNYELPTILMGGVGKIQHIVEGLSNPRVDAVATANLFNFIGPAFLDVRRSLREAGVPIPTHSDLGRDFFKGRLSC